LRVQYAGEGLGHMVKHTLAGVLLLTACVALASCGAKKAPMSAASPSEASSAGGGAAPAIMPGTPQAEIDQLFGEVEQRRIELQLPEPKAASPDSPISPLSAPPPLSTDATCKPAKTERCSSSCTMSDSICTNAERICKLASELVGDSWAADKCSRSKQTCDAAHTSCCSCT
jgi:hypothetical protein